MTMSDGIEKQHQEARRGILGRILAEPTEQIRRSIKEVEDVTNRALIVYVANFMNPFGAITPMDIVPFEDVLRTLGDVKEVDLLINSPGGDINAAEKIVTLMRDRFDSIRVIVPNQAKSAATLIATASDSIIMGYLSELGPIDSQVRVGEQFLPAQSIIDAVKRLSDEIERAKADKKPIEHLITMSHRLDPALWDFAIKAQDLSKQFAIKWLTKHMCKGDVKRAGDVAKKLMDVNRFLSHGRMINVDMAKEIFPNVIELEKEDHLWNLIWELYVRCEWETNRAGVAKLIANRTNVITVGASRGKQPNQNEQAEAGKRKDGDVNASLV